MSGHFFLYFCGHVYREDGFLPQTDTSTMAVKIRLARRGRKQMAMYDIVVADSRSPRDGKFIEKIGTYNPNHDPASVLLKETRALYWLMVGAQPTDTTRSILSHEGMMLKKHLQVGVNKGAITQEIADERFAAWKEEKANLVANAADTKSDKKVQSKVDRLEAERQVNLARAEVLRKKNAVAVAAFEAPAEVAPVAETPAPVAEAKTPVAEVHAPVVEAEAPIVAVEEVETPTPVAVETPVAQTDTETPTAETEVPATETPVAEAETPTADAEKATAE